MRLLPSSPRRRRRLLYSSPALGLALAVAIVAVFFRHSTPEAATRPGKPDVYVQPKAAPMSGKAKAQALRTLDVFIRSAALRHDLARSWSLASAKMRSGTSRADWLHGNLPVFPYPAKQFRAVSYRVTGTYVGGIVDVDALLAPKTATGLELVYSCELHPRRGRWLVDYCYPRKAF
jgi:hypothetical protein